ncbi:MAG: hypothetical protein HZC17_02640, partial [Candidatus Omnitrophica bacterium]|nr:hypothetical protein [Candidatus Omnitrophota bacterium]
GSENYIQAMMETRRSTENVFSSHLAVIRAIVDPEISERLGKNTRRLAETIFRAALSVEKNPETLVELNRLDVFRRNYIQVPFPVKHREFPNLLIPSGFKQLTFGQLEEFTSEEVQRVFSEGQSLGHSNQSSAAKILFSLTLTGFFGCTGVPEPRVSESRQKNPTIITVVNHAQDEHFVKNELTRVRNDLNDIRERRTDAIDPVQTGKITLVAAVHLGGKEVFEREIKPHFDTTYDAAPVTSATRNGKKIFILAEYVPRVEAVMGRPVSLAELGSLLDCGESSIAYRDFIEKAQVNLDELEKDRGERGEDHPEVENFLDAYRKWNRDRKVHIQYEKLSDGAYAASVRTHLFGNLAIASLIQEKRLDRFLDFSRLFALNFSNSMLKRDLDWQARIREVHKLDPEADMLFFVGGAHDPKIILKGVANQEAIGFEDPIFDSISVVPGLEKKLLEEGPDSFSDSKNNESVLTLLLDYFFVGPAINELKGDFRLRSRGEYLLLRQFVLENIKKRYGGVDGYFQQSLVDGKFASFPDLQSQVKHIRAVEGKSLGYRKMSDGIYGKLFGGDDRLGIVIFPADNLSPELAVGIRRALINQPRLIVRVIDDGTNYKLLDQLKINVAMFSRRFEVVAAAGQESVSATIRRVIQDRDLRLFHIAKSLDPSLSNLQILSRISVWAPLSELNSLNAGHVSAITAILNDRDLIQKNQEGLSRLYQFGVARKLAANQGVLDRDLRDDLHEQRSGEFVFLDFAI